MDRKRGRAHPRKHEQQTSNPRDVQERRAREGSGRLVAGNSESEGQVRNSSKFGRGTGVYACAACTRKTRQTGGDNDSLKGLENEMSDNGETPETLAKFVALKARCIAKGGKL